MLVSSRDERSRTFERRAFQHSLFNSAAGNGESLGLTDSHARQIGQDARRWKIRRKSVRIKRHTTNRTSHTISMKLAAPAILRWSLTWRFVVFMLAATSIWCLLAEFYGLCSMRLFTFAILIPATVALIVLAVVDRLRGDGMLW